MSKDRAAQLIEAGIWLKLSGDIAGARKLFERALKLDPQNEKVGELLAGAPPAITQSVPTSENPFERPRVFPSPKPVDSGLDGDWGRLTGSPSPPPQPMPPSLAVQIAEPAAVPSSVGAKPVALMAPQTIMIGGDPGPDVAPPSTPPLFGFSHAEPEPPQAEPPEINLNPGIVPGSLTVTIGGTPWPEVPPPPTPPQFNPVENPIPPPPLIPGLQSFEAVGDAWAWPSSAAATVNPDLLPEPMPSPSMPPGAKRNAPPIKLEAMDRDLALDLISSDLKQARAPEPSKDEIRSLLRGARDRLELDDHSGAMELIVKAQLLSPDDAEVIAMRERSEKTLLTMFESKLGKLETIPRVLLKDDEIIWLNLDHRAGFVLAQIDGTVSFNDLFSVSGMSQIDTARILAQLVEEGVISRG